MGRIHRHLSRLLATQILAVAVFAGAKGIWRQASVTVREHHPVEIVKAAVSAIMSSNGS